jgi:spore germination protein YaaH
MTDSSTAVKTPIPRASGEIANCTDWFAPKSKYHTCNSVLTGRHISFDEFYAMNPSVKSDCSGLSIGTHYCISTYAGGYPPGFPGWVPSSSSPVSSIPLTTSTPIGNGVSTPSPIQTGMVSTCDQFYKVIANDGCYDIASDHEITLASFYAWNPAVKTDCSGLQANEYVCVGVKSTTTSSVVTTPASGVTTPSPIQTGMISTCDTFYDVLSGDSCYDIANTYAISLDSFYAWNPAVKTDCSGLQPNDYVCIGVKSTTGTGVTTPSPIQTGMVSTCDQFYKVIANDGCYDIASSHEITLASFYAWNPAVKTDCSGLQANEYVCVGVSSA